MDALQAAEDAALHQWDCSVGGELTSDAAPDQM
jgi:hypothetical protein